MIHGIVNVLKPSAMSSHDVVGRVRHIFGMKKVGHAGTLDPLAAGVLPVFLGQATRLIEYSGDDDKTYRAEFVFGLRRKARHRRGMRSALSRKARARLPRRRVGSFLAGTSPASSA